MSIMKIIAKKLNWQHKKNDSNKLRESFSQLSHDLKNNFIAIRASIGNIKLCIHKSDLENRINTIEKALVGIDKKLNHSTIIINMMATVTGLPSDWPKDITTNSIKDCIREAIESYPFSSDRYLSFINVRPGEDFSVLGNSHLIKSIFYCLINNAVRALYNFGDSEPAIELEKNKVHFKFTDNGKITDPIEHNVFSLGKSENPGNGLIFIINALKSMNGSVELKQESNGIVTVSMLFPSNPYNI